MTAQTKGKPSAECVLREVIEALPEDASYVEIIRELAFAHMVERGLADVRSGRSVSHDEALQRMRSWWN